MMKMFPLLIAAIFFASSAQASIITYDITVQNNWFDSNGTPYDMPLSPTLTGQITVDNTLTDLAALVAFSLTTGSRTWTEADFTGTSASDIGFLAGELSFFRLDEFGSRAAGDFMYIFSSNTFSVREFSSAESNSCNGCVSFGRASVPVPATLALFGLGLAGLGWSRRKKA